MRFSTRKGFVLSKKGFTIWEILIIIIVVSVGLMAVVVVLTNGTKYIQKTRQKVIALDLAREGMEAIYQMRDTNRTRRAGVKDMCRLKINPLVDEDPAIRCADDQWMMSGAYALQRLVLSGQEYFALTGVFTPLNISDGIDANDAKFSLCQTGGRRDACIGTIPTDREGKYFRQIQGQGLYLKDTNEKGGTPIVCSSGVHIDCANDRAKEFRFCSKVEYLGDTTGHVELCGIITNFK